MVAPRRSPALLAAALLAVTQLAVPDTAPAQRVPDPRPLFADDEPLALKITGPLRQLLLDANGNDRPEHDFVIELADVLGGPRALNAEIRIRGKSRLANCDFPPLRLDFAGDEAVGTAFEGQNHLKLVTLCRRSDAYRDYLALEFRIYRILNALTDHSFRVRWTTVEYLDTERRRPEPFMEPAFLIEEDWEVAERLGLDVIDTQELAIDALDPEYTTLLALFQYLIANTDWAVLEGPAGEGCCHNGKPIGAAEGPTFVLPYDFDQAGLINPPYAVPDERLGIHYVSVRLYRGFCAMNGEVDAAISRFNALRGTFEGLLDDESINEKTRRRSLKYLDGFFEIVNDPEEREDEIFERCRE